jgi:hypothetical protein
MPEVGLDKTQCIQVPPSADVLRLREPGLVLIGFIDCRCVADRVDVKP